MHWVEPKENLGPKVICFSALRETITHPGNHVNTPPHTAGSGGAPITEHFDVLIVGAGISGVGSAVHMQEQCPERSFVILEKFESFGGTWHMHKYPGVRSDSDLYTFGYRFKPWVGPPIATADEIRKYMNEVIDDNGLAPHIRYRNTIKTASFDSSTNLWTLEVLDGATKQVPMMAGDEVHVRHAVVDGVDVLSLRGADSANVGGETVGTGYLRLSGTSMAAPQVAGTVALMLQANPNLTPNLVKAILQYTAREDADYSPLQEGAGFLDVLGAVRLSRFYARNRAGARLPVQESWSRHFIWGNQMVEGGYINPLGNAWAANIVWGTSITPDQSIVRGTARSADNIVWGTLCGDQNCTNIVWGTADVGNIVWKSELMGGNGVGH